MKDMKTVHFVAISYAVSFVSNGLSLSSPCLSVLSLCDAAGEWISGATCMFLANYLAEAYGTEGRVST